MVLRIDRIHVRPEDGRQVDLDEIELILEKALEAMLSVKKFNVIRKRGGFKVVLMEPVELEDLDIELDRMKRADHDIVNLHWKLVPRGNRLLGMLDLTVT